MHIQSICLLDLRSSHSPARARGGRRGAAPAPCARGPPAPAPRSCARLHIKRDDRLSVDSQLQWDDKPAFVRYQHLALAARRRPSCAKDATDLLYAQLRLTFVLMIDVTVQLPHVRCLKAASLQPAASAKITADITARFALQLQS